MFWVVAREPDFSKDAVFVKVKKKPPQWIKFLAKKHKTLFWVYFRTFPLKKKFSLNIQVCHFFTLRSPNFMHYFKKKIMSRFGENVITD